MKGERMMSKIRNSGVISVILSLILGKVSFLISGVLACIVILNSDNYILGTIIAGGIGGLIFGLFYWKDKKIVRMTIAGLCALLIGFLGSFMLAEGLVSGLEFLFPSIIGFFEISGIADLIAIILMEIMFGVIFGAIVYGRHSLGLFATVCGVVSIPGGVLVVAMNSGHHVKVLLSNLFQIFGKIDLNFLVIIVGFGVGIGLSFGLYRIVKKKE